MSGWLIRNKWERPVSMVLNIYRNHKGAGEGVPGGGGGGGRWLVTRVESATVLLYVHRNRRLIRDGSPGRPPRLWHSSSGLTGDYIPIATLSPPEWLLHALYDVSLIVMDKVSRQCPQTTTFLKRKDSRRIEPRPFCLPVALMPLPLG